MPESTFWLSTERLALRRCERGDLDWLASVYGDTDVMRHLGGPQDRAKVSRFLDVRVLQYYDEHPGLGIWVTTERASGKPIGLHNLNHIQGEPFIQVGFVLVREAWDKGFASEMAFALLRYGFVDLALPRICGIANLDNLASQRVLQKIGLRRQGERTFAAYASDGPQAWFERTAVDWLAQVRSPIHDTAAPLQIGNPRR